MPKFRKRPVVIEAFQWLGQEVGDWPEWAFLHNALGPELASNGDPTGKLAVETLEGSMTGSHGDWVIKGVQGEVYFCKPDIFAATYEAVDG